ncbi:plasma-membrane choline transporter-domain-containing protein [Diplogelasinospora grovesii]|uniref:Protein PNS1 n=1 Tax=Diplogelasinospora grovesii TaxID=303347 RepID=A0AAN6NF58_9PEZI|nr:plasma-membrane choline transporter-domain-containing protein [Diplogelasinospora grovesii]
MASGLPYGGESANYYQPPPGPPNNTYQMQSPQGGYYNNGQHNNQHQEPPKYGGNNDGGYGAPPQGPPPTFDQAFTVQKPKWNDLWAGILFLLTCAAFVAVSGISIQGYGMVPRLRPLLILGREAATRGQNSGGLNGQANDFGLTTHTIYLFLWVLLTAIILSYAYVWLARMFTKQFIWITGILNIVFGAVIAIYMLSRHYYSGGIVFIIFTVFMVIAFITWIPRIPFSALMLQTAIDVAKNHGHVYAVSAVGGLLATAFAGWYSVTLVAIYVKYEPSNNNVACRQGAGGCSSAKVIGLIVFITFASYWISEWLKNTIHTTIAGVYGSWYFNSRNFPTKVTRGALRRSLTYSFGSISLGSLVVAIINFLRQLCSIAQQQSASEGDILGTILWCVVGCLIGILDWAVQFVNRYAFSHIALYGKAYIPAAKDTWRMIKDRGIDALVNECLVGPVLSMGATFVAYACALLAYLYLIFTHPAYNATGGYTPVVVAFAFLIGLQICNVFTTPLSSGIDTIFVAAAWDPEVMMRDHPDLYHRMVQVYPHVQQAIHA